MEKSILTAPPGGAKVKERDRTSVKRVLAEGIPWAFHWSRHPWRRGRGLQVLGGMGGHACTLHTQYEGWWGAGCRQGLLSGRQLSLPPS